MGKNIWQWLEIEPTTDRKQIRKAYAKQVQIYHPAEHPQEAAALHEAYEKALAYAKSQGQSRKEPLSSTLSDGSFQQEIIFEHQLEKKKAAKLPKPPQLPPKLDEKKVLMQQLDEILSQENQKQTQRMKSACEKLAQFRLTKIRTIQTWSSFLRDKDVQSALEDSGFQKEIADLLRERPISKGMRKKLLCLLPPQAALLRLVLEQPLKTGSDNRSNFWKMVLWFIFVFSIIFVSAYISS